VNFTPFAARVDHPSVSADPRYLTAFGSTQSEIIVPVFDARREHVIGTIDVESEYRNAFDQDTQRVLEESARIIAPLWQR
jgi:putative methionine-R-sulfoxide reductase with GAF domain